MCPEYTTEGPCQVAASTAYACGVLPDSFQESLFLFEFLSPPGMHAFQTSAN